MISSNTQWWSLEDAVCPVHFRGFWSLLKGAFCKTSSLHTSRYTKGEKAHKGKNKFSISSFKSVPFYLYSIKSLSPHGRLYNHLIVGFSHLQRKPNNWVIPYEQARGKSGKEKLSGGSAWVKLERLWDLRVEIKVSGKFRLKSRSCIFY